MAIVKPDLTRVFASNALPANVIDPDTEQAGKVAAGWNAQEIPPAEWFNFIQNWQTGAAAYNNEQGINEWDANTSYPVNAIAKGSDGELYKCIVAGAGNDPVSSAEWTSRNKSGFEFATIADVATLTTVGGKIGRLQVGDSVRVLDYAAGHNSGVLFFRVVAAGTGVDDGGKYIDLPTLGLQLEQNMKIAPTIKDFGAADVSVLDDSSSAILNALEYCGGSLVSTERRKLILPSGLFKYKSSSQMLVQCDIEGCGIGSEILADESDVTGGLMKINSRMLNIKGFVLTCNDTNTDQFAIDLEYSAAEKTEISDLVIYNSQNGIVVDSNWYGNVHNIRFREKFGTNPMKSTGSSILIGNRAGTGIANEVNAVSFSNIYSVHHKHAVTIAGTTQTVSFTGNNVFENYGTRIIAGGVNRSLVFSGLYIEGPTDSNTLVVAGSGGSLDDQRVTIRDSIIRTSSTCFLVSGNAHLTLDNCYGNCPAGVSNETGSVVAYQGFNTVYLGNEVGDLNRELGGEYNAQLGVNSDVRKVNAKEYNSVIPMYTHKIETSSAGTTGFFRVKIPTAAFGATKYMTQLNFNISCQSDEQTLATFSKYSAFIKLPAASFSAQVRTFNTFADPDPSGLVIPSTALTVSAEGVNEVTNTVDFLFNYTLVTEITAYYPITIYIDMSGSIQTNLPDIATFPWLVEKIHI